MSIEIAAIAGSSAAGIISAAVIDKFSKGRIKSTQEKPQAVSITSAKAELSSLVFEKSLCSEAITRVYEAAQKGDIDRLERDRLLLKYKQQLESIDARASKLQTVTDFADMTDLRNNLASLLEERIAAIDNKLLEMSKRGVANPLAESQVRRIVEDVTIDKDDKGSHASRRDEDPLLSVPEEKSIEQLQKDILQALQRLEQVEVDKD